MGRLRYLILSLLFVSCSLDTTTVIHGDTGVVTNISLNGGDYYLVTVTFYYKDGGAGYTDNIIFYTKKIQYK